MLRLAVVVLALGALLAQVASAGPRANRCCPALVSWPGGWSADGSRVSFLSNLAHPADLDQYDSYVVNTDGTGLAAMRADGRYVETPDGRRVAFVTRDGGVVSLVDEQGSETRVLVRGVIESSVVASPDGRRLAYAISISLKVAHMYVLDVADVTSEPRLVGTGYAAAWSPDGSSLAVEDDDEVYVVELASGHWLLSSQACCYDPQLPVFSPDGSHAAFSASARRDDRLVAYAVELESGRIVDLGPGCCVDSWSPDSSRIAFDTARGIVTAGRDGKDRVLLLPDVGHFSFASDWTRYVFAVPVWHGTDLYVVETANPLPRRLLASQCSVIEDRCLAGDSRGNRLTGRQRRDVILAGFGNDRLVGKGGNDRLEGEFGDDTIDAGPGADNAFGGSGSDRLYGGGGPDRLSGGPGDDSLAGGAETNGLFGDEGNDVVSGGPGRDNVFGGVGDDRLDAGDGTDTVHGGDGSDVLNGGAGADVLFPGYGRDTVTGGAGDDVVIATPDRVRDVISCGAGNDRVRAEARDRVSRDCERVRRVTRTG